MSTMAQETPQHLSIVTIGAHDFSELRRFYQQWGWQLTESSADYDDWCAFDMNGCLLSIYPLDLLGHEAAPGQEAPVNEWRGITFAITLSSEDELKRAYEAALAAGATSVSAPTKREWGGTSGYVADPEGTRWELAIGGPNPAPPRLR